MDDVDDDVLLFGRQLVIRREAEPAAEDIRTDVDALARDIGI